MNIPRIGKELVVNIYKDCDSFPISLFVTGENIEQATQNFCNKEGLCVTVTPTNYIFTGGNETGYIIGMINYPRFPKGRPELVDTAIDLAFYLIDQCNPEGSFTIQTPDNTIFCSNRPGD